MSSPITDITDPAINPMPRRRWTRWLLLALVGAGGFALWMMNGEGESIRRSRSVRLGTTIAEVRTIMGEPAVTLQLPFGASGNKILRLEYATPSEEFFYRCRRDLWHAVRSVGLWGSEPPLRPVEVIFDGDRATHIRRGSETELP